MVVEVLAANGLERAVVWLPAVVLGTGLVCGVLILLGRAFAATVRDSGHPRLILGGLVAFLGAVVLMTWLGIELPRE
jgi:hypothetical protein